MADLTVRPGSGPLVPPRPPSTPPGTPDAPLPPTPAAPAPTRDRSNTAPLDIQAAAERVPPSGLAAFNGSASSPLGFSPEPGLALPGGGMLPAVSRAVGTGIAELESAHAAIDTANEAVQKVEEDIQAGLRNFGAALTPEQQAAFAKNYRQKHQQVYDAQTAAQQKLAESLTRNQDALTAYAATPQGVAALAAGPLHDALTTLARSPNGYAAVQAFATRLVDQPGWKTLPAAASSAGTTAIAHILEHASFTQMQDKPPKGGVEAAQSFMERLGEKVAADGSGELNAIRQLRSAVRMVPRAGSSAAMVKSSARALGTMPFGRLASLATVVLAPVEIRNSLGKQDCLDLLKNVASTGAAAIDVAAAVRVVANCPAFKTAQDLVPVLNIVAGAAGAWNNVQQGEYLAAVGDGLLATSGAAALLATEAGTAVAGSILGTTLGGAAVTTLGVIGSAAAFVGFGIYVINQVREDAAETARRRGEWSTALAAGGLFPPERARQLANTSEVAMAALSRGPIDPGQGAVGGGLGLSPAQIQKLYDQGYYDSLLGEPRGAATALALAQLSRRATGFDGQAVNAMLGDIAAATGNKPGDRLIAMSLAIRQVLGPDFQQADVPAVPAAELARQIAAAAQPGRFGPTSLSELSRAHPGMAERSWLYLATAMQRAAT